MRISRDYIIREIAGECVIVPTGEAAARFNGLITVNGVGAFLWHMLQEETDEDKLLQALLEEYETDEATAKADIAQFLRILEQNGILER
ncbi:MAG: PqqD family protein [Candidatus Onthomonas sp.]